MIFEQFRDLSEVKFRNFVFYLVEIWFADSFDCVPCVLIL